MRRTIGKIFAWIGFVFVVLVVVGVIAAVRLGKKKEVPAKALLELNLEQELVETESSDPLAQLTGKNKLSMRDVLDALEKAESDGRVSGLLARIGAAKMGLAHVQELRNAVLRFRAKGKFAVVYAETFGEFSPGNGAYYLATAFEQIWLQPSGDVGLVGVQFESPFIKNTLDKLGIKPRFDHRYEYKNAMNLFTETKFTAAHKEATEKVASGWFGQMVKGIAEGRKIPEQEVRATIDRGPFLGQEAVKEKLVDQVGYRDEFYAKARERAGSGAELLFLSRYLERVDRPHQNKKDKTVALIYGLGAVERGKGNTDPLSGSQSLGSDTVASAFRAAIDDKDVKAVLFRVDSPGGSYVASDTIWNEVVRARKAGKPVIVSMGNVAGSGGYFVAMAADKIVAQPATITGSIGVLGGKFVPTELLDKVGITSDEVHFGQNAGMFNTLHDFSPAEWQRFQQWLDRVYEDFTSKVAEGRKLPKERVREIAKGRIWTGEDAKGIGLVDELGGMYEALALTKAAINVPLNEDVYLKEFPLKKSTAEQIMAKLKDDETENSDKEATTAVRVLESVRPLVRALEKAGVYGTHGVLEMEDVPAAN